MHQRIASREQKFSSKLVNRVCITEDVICLLEGFTITAINQKPSREDLVDFAASYFEEIRKKRDLLAERGIGNFRTGLYLSSEWNGQVWHERIQEACKKNLSYTDFNLTLKGFSREKVLIILYWSQTSIRLTSNTKQDVFNTTKVSTAGKFRARRIIKQISLVNLYIKTDYRIINFVK